MTLQNLLKIGQLVEHATDKKQVGSREAQRDRLHR